MITVERRFTVDRPLRTVFDFIADFTHTEQWDPGTVRTTRQDSGPIRVGSRFHNVSKFLGRATELDYELRTLDDLSHLVFIGVNKTATATDDLSFHSAGTGTEIHYVSHIQFHGAARAVSRLVQRPFEKIADRTVEQMQTVLAGL